MNGGGSTWGYQTVLHEGEVAEWAARHDITLDARRTHTDEECERWVVSATTERGQIKLEVETDGSYEVTAVGQLFEPWRDEEPSTDEFNAAVAVLGEDAVRELALLVGWAVDPTTSTGRGEGGIAGL